MNVSSLVTSWLLTQDEESKLNLQTFIDDYFYKALEWVLKQVFFLYGILTLNDPLIFIAIKKFSLFCTTILL